MRLLVRDAGDRVLDDAADDREESGEPVPLRGLSAGVTRGLLF